MEECKFASSNGKCEKKLKSERSDVRGSLEYRQRERKLELCEWCRRSLRKRLGRFEENCIETVDEQKHEFQCVQVWSCF